MAQNLSKKTVIDVRTRPEYAAEHITGSIHIPLHQVSSFREQLQDADNVVFVCRSGARAAKAQKKAQTGEVLEGGISAYKQAGGVVEGIPVKWDISSQVRTLAGSLVLVGSILTYVHSPYWLLLTGFIGAGLAFAGITGTCGMAKALARLPANSRKKSDIRAELSKQ